MRRTSLAAVVLACVCATAWAQTLLPIADELRVAPTESEQLTFTVDGELIQRTPALRLLARLDREALGGSTFSMAIFVNEQRILVDRLLNKPDELELYNGMQLVWMGQASFRAVYSPDYEAANRDDHPFCIVGGKAYEFVLALDGLIHEGENTLRILHTQERIENALALAEIALVKPPEPLADDSVVGQPAPTGDIPMMQPATVGPVAYEIEPLSRGGFAVSCGGQRVHVQSSFSYPNVGWNRLGETRGDEEEATWRPSVANAEGGLQVSAQGTSYSLRRTVARHDDHITVSDRLTNLTDQDLHISLRHSFLTEGLDDPEVWLQGLKLRMPQGNQSGGDNPTALLIAGETGFGMVAEDDVLRSQCSQVADAELGEVGLLDHLFMLMPGAEYEIRWSVYPLPGGGYWEMVNAIRRNWGTNFAITGPFMFAPHPGIMEEQIPDLQAWLDNGSASIVSSQIPRIEDKRLLHGLDFLDRPEVHRLFKDQADLLHGLRPGVKMVTYIDVYITTGDEHHDKYPGAWHLRADGTPGMYDRGSWRGNLWMYLPTPHNGYGREMNRYFDLCMDELGFDGIYWDQVARSSERIAYGITDGHSAIPDPETMTVREKVGLVELVCQSYQMQQARRVLDAGGTLIGNSQPRTETMTKLHYPRFVEAWHPSKLRNAHLYCPLGLGSPDRILSEDDIAANIRDNMEWGGLWYYYLGWWRVQLTHKTITEHMFPFTPVELHPGVLIGQERILASRSGLMGWGDDSEHRVYAYDHLGYLQEDFEAPTRIVDGSTYTELRLPGGWMAAIVRDARG